MADLGPSAYCGIFVVTGSAVSYVAVFAQRRAGRLGLWSASLVGIAVLLVLAATTTTTVVKPDRDPAIQALRGLIVTAARRPEASVRR